MRVESAGVWLDRSSSPPELWMVAKLPMNLIRAVNAGAAVSLRAWLVDIDGEQVGVFGLQVDDDREEPCVIYGACRSEEQVEDLRALLNAAAFPLQIHNEVFLPVLNADCAAAPHLAHSVLDLLLPGRDWPPAEVRQARTRALDVIQDSLAHKASDDVRIQAHCVEPLTFQRKEVLKVYVPGSGLVHLGDAGQGNELERLVFQAFEFLCPFGAFHQPQVEEQGELRELCDVLAVSRMRECKEEGVFVIQSKVASEWSEGLTRSATRRAASIKKSIVCAISQLKGAIRRLRSGAPVFRADGTPIEIDPPGPEITELIEPLNLRERANRVGHGIALVSDMHQGVDWKEVARLLRAAGSSTEYLFHVLDLRELQRLVSYSGGRPAVFEAHLVRRWQTMVQQGSALVRSRVPP